ncbi:uncharacterized protein LOC112088108 [Eutrema salsugineum]|uniref:uncharacterized protein LOC112088108 n=1 Tax=Eutrema salsugineum TaxID=72664 RepID=UPI000CED450B|nr:uncharacterized protein LOC112088108 [Eutrema salsugineum]
MVPGQKNGNKSGLGWVFRNNGGDVVWIGAKAVPRLRSAIETEAEALRWAASTMEALNDENFVFETDSKELVDALSGKSSWPILDAVLQDTQNMLHRIGNVEVKHYPR